MGFRPSPYYGARFYYWAEEFARGNRKDSDNPLRWDSVKLNLPGDLKWNPAFPRVMKSNDATANIAGDLKAFEDDLRCSGVSEEHAWQIGRWVAAIFQYLGIQDTPRKRKPPVLVTAAWAESMFSTALGKIEKFVSQKKWDKARKWINHFLTELARDPEVLFKYKEMVQATGFLRHLSMTYEDLAPYLKGFYLSLHRHLPRRDTKGWKMNVKRWDAYVHSKLDKEDITPEEAHEMLHPPAYENITAPPEVPCIPELLQALPALETFFKQPNPPRILVRSAHLLYVRYGFADASGTGLGASITTDEGIRIRIGTWGQDSEEETSNWREFENLVTTLEAEGKKGNLDGAVVVMCTDNSTAESAANKASSASQNLYKLAARLRALQFQHGAQFIISHVAGKRMKDQGTDGVSRGHLKEGIAMGTA
jgi:hypothetical protein